MKINEKKSRTTEMLILSHGTNLIITLVYMFIQAKSGHSVDPTVMMISLGAEGLGHGTANWKNAKVKENGQSGNP